MFFRDHKQSVLVTGSLLMMLFTPLCPADSPGVYTGAGAHSSWLIMNKIKPLLEKKIGHNVKLFGKQSMLGVGCNAGIKSSQQSRPSHGSFGMVCCPLSKEEIRKNNLAVYPLTYEPIIILVNKNNPISNLTSTQVNAIFSGKITNRKTLGGDDQNIVVITRLHCKKRPGHWKTILNDPKAFASKRINVESADEMVKRVGDFKAAIGHAGRAWLLDDNSNTKLIRINGFLPDGKNLQTKRYPYYQKLSIVTQKDASAELKNLARTAQQLTFNNQALLKDYQLLVINPDIPLIQT